jgi:hypothetical protein
MRVTNRTPTLRRSRAGDAFPIGAELAGRWRIVERLRGTPDRGVYRAHGTGDPRALVTMTTAQDAPVAELYRRHALDVRGVTPLRWIGTLVTAGGDRHVALVEAEPDGAPLEVAEAPMPIAHAAAIGRDLVSILAHVHAIGAVVMGLRPEVIYCVDEHQVPSVTTIAPRGERFFATQPLRPSAVAACFDHVYAAPEARRTRDLTPAADVHSLCAVLAHLALARQPSDTGSPAQHVTAGAGRRAPPPMPPELVEVIDAGLAADPQARPALATVDRVLARLAARR